MPIESLVPQFNRPRPDLVTGGQPDAPAWAALRGEGFTTVVNLRTVDEMAGRDEAGEVASAGLTYHAIPVAGAAGINEANAAKLREVLATAEGPVLVHCASGNRVGGLLALVAAQEGGDPREALEFGKASGLTGAEPLVRELLGLPAE